MQLRIVLVSDDHHYSYGVLSEITKLNHEVIVTEMNWAGAGDAELDHLTVVGDMQVPTIVMMDFAFGRPDAGAAVDQLTSWRPGRAIECIAMRPPVDEKLRKTLAQRDVFLFESPETAKRREYALN